MQQWRPFIYMGFVSLGLLVLVFGKWILFPKQEPVVEPITFFLEMGDKGEASGLVAVERSLRPRQFEVRAVDGAVAQIAEPIAMSVEVKSQSSGQVLFQAEHKLPLDGNGKWTSFRAEFVPRNEGEHLMTVVVGKPVASVQLTVDR
jgi:hypothetical protein